MAIRDIIDSRRSERSFSDKPVEKEKLDSLLHAALHAPTGRNSQPLFFVILQDKKKMEELFSRVDVRNNFYHCDAILFVMAREDDYLNDLNCGAAIENVLLQGEELSLATCWIHSARKFLDTEQGREALKDVLELSKEYHPLDAVAIGYLKGERPVCKDRRIDGCKIL